MKIRVGATSDMGRVRTNNEDAYLVDAHVYAVADGMGGVEAGEIASGLAIDTLRQMGSEWKDGAPRLVQWVQQANKAIFTESSSDAARAGMGTTLTAVTAEDGHVRLAHVGDSRAYLLRNGDLRQLTEDHTRVHKMVQEGILTEAEAATHPDRNILSRALGIGSEVPVDERVVDVRKGDRILLCTDGLYGMVREEMIKEILRTMGDPQVASERLVAAANAGGGADNVTVVVLDIEAIGHGEKRGGLAGIPRRWKAAGAIAPVALVAIVVTVLLTSSNGQTRPVSSPIHAPTQSPTSTTDAAAVQNYANALVNAASGTTLATCLEARLKDLVNNEKSRDCTQALNTSLKAIQEFQSKPVPITTQEIGSALQGAVDLFSKAFANYKKAASKLDEGSATAQCDARESLTQAERQQKNGYKWLRNAGADVDTPLFPNHASPSCPRAGGKSKP